MLDSVVETLKPQIEAMHLNVYVNATEFTVFASLDHIKGIFYNLISNAIKYNKQNGRIDVVLKKNQKNMYFSVEDTGVGIAQEDQSRIFQRFYRVDKERSKNNTRYRFRFVDCKTCCLLLSRQNPFNFKGRCGN